ncbi:MAG: ATP-binding cassette domain-containing protein [Anaeromicrobium sp.]|jgi:peptide/nickel transport system ATP-binding protein|uniref:ABC transporter ATP-binding protein n=1 Tax=Anaeromicrobium sp. TaxID=1929132 RepID=UPI0025F523B0|nr:oligopeptide/dipeptide ABC transporter ATP-binding protein [Anaeromicrobium sp.]MCT4593987.1 ATP-binding cassette domain-containing protein [Anaeromicrobium sp.]
MNAFIEVNNLKKYFKTPGGMLHAVDNISFKIQKGETLGVVGESGCGKSTLGRTLIHLLKNTDGQIKFDGEDITNVSGKRLKELRKDMQIVFQDPFSSLNPRMTVSQIIGEPMIVSNMYKDNKTIAKKVSELMDTVGIADRLVNSYPHELDGGRRQRVGIARTLALEPKFIVCDEPVSALDVSIQAQVLNLMQDLQEERDLTYLFITHDLSVVKHISDNILVMYLGNMVEYASADKLFENQYHPYTQALLSAIPIAKIGHKRKRILLTGEISSPINPKPGCRFAMRCKYAKDRCHQVQPEMIEIKDNHHVACHYVKEINGIE